MENNRSKDQNPAESERPYVPGDEGHDDQRDARREARKSADSLREAMKNPGEPERPYVPGDDADDPLNRRNEAEREHKKTLQEAMKNPAEPDKPYVPGDSDGSAVMADPSTLPPGNSKERARDDAKNARDPRRSPTGVPASTTRSAGLTPGAHPNPGRTGRTPTSEPVPTTSSSADKPQT